LRRRVEVSLAEKLADHAREGSAGAAAYRGFTYQHHWTLCKLLEVHEQPEDYVLLVDHHDDVIVWSEPPDGLLRCFQVKAKGSGNWTTAALLKRKGDALSILGKLYHHTIFFEGDVESLEVVSNARFSVGRLSDGSPSLDRVRIQCSELSADVATKIRLALQGEHDLSEDPAFEELVCFERSAIPLEAFREHTVGRVTEMLDTESGGQPVRSKAAYQALMDEIERRASIVATAFPREEALRRKSLHRGEVVDMLADMLARPSQETWSTIAGGLSVAGYGPVRIARLRLAHGTLSARRTAAEWSFVEGMIEAAHEVVMSLDDDATLEECLAATLPELRAREDSAGLGVDDLDLIVMEALYRV
jgi:Cap4-like dsDNA endonuclease family protein